MTGGSSGKGAGDAPFPGAIADITSFWRWPGNAARGESPAIRNTHPHGRTTAEAGGVFRGKCVSREFPGVSDARPWNSPADCLASHPSPREIPRGSPGRYSPENFPAAGISRGIPRETAARAKKVGAVWGGGGGLVVLCHSGLSVPTVGGKLEYYKYKTYLNWKSAMSFSYLNNEDDIDRSLEKINAEIKSLQDQIKNYIVNKNNIFRHQ